MTRTNFMLNSVEHDLLAFSILEIGSTLFFMFTRGRSRISGKGIHMYKGVGGSLCWFYLIFLKYPIKMKWFGLIETKLFHFHRIFKNGCGEGCSSEPPEHSLDQPLFTRMRITYHPNKIHLIPSYTYNLPEGLMFPTKSCRCLLGGSHSTVPETSINSPVLSSLEVWGKPCKNTYTLN